MCGQTRFHLENHKSSCSLKRIIIGNLCDHALVLQWVVAVYYIQLSSFLTLYLGRQKGILALFDLSTEKDNKTSRYDGGFCVCETPAPVYFP